MLTNTRLSGKMSAQQKTDIDNAVKNNNILIKNKEAEKIKLTATPLGGENVTTSTATVNDQTPKSREDQAAIDAGRGL
jgi:hypothetical protein